MCWGILPGKATGIKTYTLPIINTPKAVVATVQDVDNEIIEVVGVGKYEHGSFTYAIGCDKIYTKSAASYISIGI